MDQNQKKSIKKFAFKKILVIINTVKKGKRFQDFTDQTIFTQKEADQKDFGWLKTFSCVAIPKRSKWQAIKTKLQKSTEKIDKQKEKMYN